MKSLSNCSSFTGISNRSMRFLLVLLLNLSALSLDVKAQCGAPPAQPACTGTELADNDNLTIGVTKVVSGASSFSNLTINGGTLIVCGTLNLASFTFNSGTIYVRSGGILNVNTSASIVFGANSSIYNFGTVYFASSIVTGANSLLMNCLTTSYFNVPFNQLVLQGPNTQLINNGIFNSSFFIVQSNNSPNPVCGGPSSMITTGIMINQYANAFTTPVGASCIQVSNQAINSQPMTTNPLINICYNGSSASGQNFGNATVTLNCTSCFVALPVDEIELDGSCINNMIDLQWTVQTEQACSHYEVQVSEDGTSFHNVRDMDCGSSSSAQHYSCILDRSMLPLLNYARVKRSDSDGNESFSDLLVLDCLGGVTIDIFPTYVAGSEVTIKSDERIVAVSMYGMDGRKVKNFEIQPDQKIIVLDIGESTALGQYLLTVETASTRIDKLIRVAH